MAELVGVKKAKTSPAYKLIDMDQDSLDDTEAKNGYSRVNYNHWCSYLLIPAFFTAQFLITGLINNIGTIKTHWDNSGVTKSIFLEQTPSANFGFIYISAILACYCVKHMGADITFTLGCVISSLSLAVVTYFPNDLILLVFYGVIMGTGVSLVIFSTLFVLKDCFFADLTVINGVVASGSCLGTMIQSMFIDSFCNMYGWRVVFRYYASGVLIMSLIGILIFFSYKKKIQKKTYSLESTKLKGHSTFTTVLRNPRFVILCVSLFVFCLGYLVIYLYIKKYAESRGIGNRYAQTLVGYFSIGSLFGRITFGFIGNFLNRRKIILLMLCVFLMGTLNILSIFCMTFKAYVVYCLILGVFDGAIVALLFPVICDMFDNQHKIQKAEFGSTFADKTDQENMATAICFATQGISFLIGPLITNIMVQKGLSYSTLFFISGITLASSSLIMGTVKFFE